MYTFNNNIKNYISTAKDYVYAIRESVWKRVPDYNEIVEQISLDTAAKTFWDHRMDNSIQKLFGNNPTTASFIRSVSKLPAIFFSVFMAVKNKILISIMIEEMSLAIPSLQSVKHRL